jgi:hypothetical protein
MKYYQSSGHYMLPKKNEQSFIGCQNTATITAMKTKAY